MDAVCPVGVFTIMFAGVWVMANTGAWMDKKNTTAVIVAATLRRSLLRMYVFLGLIILPHSEQEALFWSVGEVHSWHVFCGLLNILVFSIFSEKASSRRVPMKVRTKLPSRWKTWRAVPSP